jgi:alkylglycerol monooxygenase
MPFPAAALLGLAVLAAVVDWVAVWFEGLRWRAVERIAKPAVLVLLLVGALAWPLPAEASASVRTLLVVALAASLAGDVLLLPPGRLLPGLVAFLVGHVAYAFAFAQFEGSAAWLLAGIVAAVGVGLTAGRRLVAAARPSGMAGPVAAYLAVISAMAIAATRTGMPAAIVGAWLFVASDAMLGYGQFVAGTGRDGRSPRLLRMGVITTYHVGQLLLVLSLL